MCVRLIALTAVLSLPAAAVAQLVLPNSSTNVSPAPKGPTPRTPDGHPDLTGIWSSTNGGVSNQQHNQGIAIESDTHTLDIHTGMPLLTWPVPSPRKPQDIVVRGHAATLLHRVGSNLPVYKPEYWAMVNELDLNSNEVDPAHHCMPAGVPRVGIPGYIGQFPNYLIFIYPGQPAGGAFRMIPTDGRQHTPLNEVDPTAMGEGIGHWEGDTLVVDTWGFSNDTWFDQPENGGGGFFHSDNMRVIERFHRDGNTLTWTVTVEDPDVLLEPWTATRRVSTLNPNPKAVISSGYPCMDIAISHSVGKERH
jgi:hypothetical protein